MSENIKAETKEKTLVPFHYQEPIRYPPSVGSSLHRWSIFTAIQ